MKPLDMADKYDPLSYQDEEPTIRVQVPTFQYQVVVEADDPHGDRDTIPSPPPFQEKRYPGIGLLIVLSTGLLFWGTVAYFIFR